MKFFKTFFVVIIVFSSCVEEYNFQVLNTDELLVVEATITDEYKHQEVTLSNTYSLKDSVSSFERNAKVTIEDLNGVVYDFQETNPGKYISVNKFKAQINSKYFIKITRSNGNTYKSLTSNLTGIKKMDSIYAKRRINDFGVDGISIFVDSNDETNKSKFYRYEFVETNKVILPYFSNLDLEIVSDVFPYEFRTIPKTEEDRVCYREVNSKSVIQTTTLNLTADRVSKFEVNFLPGDDYFLIYGYSILVKQYIQSYEAYSYYKTLNNQSISSSNFSNVQPGFINGNVTSLNNPEEKVIGFFEVSSMSEKRIFFDYKDFYPTEPYPRFRFDCTLITPEIAKGHYPESSRSPLLEAIRQGDYVFYAINPDAYTTASQGPYLMVPKECSDCRTQGTNIKPNYWN